MYTNKKNKFNERFIEKEKELDDECIGCIAAISKKCKRQRVYTRKTSYKTSANKLFLGPLKQT